MVKEKREKDKTESITTNSAQGTLKQIGFQTNGTETMNRFAYNEMHWSIRKAAPNSKNDGKRIKLFDSSCNIGIS